MFRKLRNKLLFVNMTILTLVMLAAFTAIYVITYSNIQNENSRKMDTLPSLSITGGTENPVVPPGDGQDTQNFERSVIHGYASLPLDYTQSFIISVDDNGNILHILTHIDMPRDVYTYAVRQTWDSGEKEGRIDLEGRTWQYRITSASGTKVIYRNGQRQQSIEAEGGQRIAFLDITDTNKTLINLLITFSIVAVAMLAVLFLISFWFASRSIKPIEENWNKQKQFVTDASHELKTPLSIINANMEVLRSNGNETVDSQKEWLDYMNDETNRMNKLINDLLFLARAETVREENLPVDLGQAALDVVASMEAVIYEKSVRLTAEITPDVIVKGDAGRFKQAMLVLLDNAAKYTDPGGIIHVSVQKSRSHALFSVQNNGKAIPKEELDKIFDRFYRCDASRSHETGGYGLGLSIAKAIIERAGGEIRVQSENGVTAFYFSLKLY